jgi:hypothetical protein
MIFLISVEVAIEPAVGGSPPPPHTHTPYHWISHGAPQFFRRKEDEEEEEGKWFIEPTNTISG